MLTNLVSAAEARPASSGRTPRRREAAPTAEYRPAEQAIALKFQANRLAANEVLGMASAASTAQLVVPVAGAVDVVADKVELRVGRGAGLLLAAPGCFSVGSPEAASFLVIALPRTLIQQCAFLELGAPLRLAKVVEIVDLGPVAARLEPELRRSFEACGGSARAEAILDRGVGSAVLIRLVGALAASAPGALIPAGSVERAILHLREHLEQACSAEQLARAAGVTLPVLRRNFRDCLGVSLNRHVLDVQIEWARERLRARNEVRSVGQIAHTLGLQRTAFSRAYQRKFGESPTETRAISFGTHRSQ